MRGGLPQEANHTICLKLENTVEDKTEQRKGEPEAWEVRPAAIQKDDIWGELTVRHLGVSISGNGNSQGQSPKVGAFLEC